MMFGTHPLSREGPVLSDLMVRYPFAPQSRQFFERLPIEESFSSNDVLAQAENRLLSSLGRARYEPHISELIDFSSFFVVALVAAQDIFLTRRFAAKEGERAKSFFVKENTPDKPAIFNLCLGLKIARSESEGVWYQLRVEDYLRFATKLELVKSARWQLVNQSLSNGIVYLSENAANDLFGEAAERMIQEGVRNLRRAQFPKQLAGLRDGVIQYIPLQRARSTRGYLYVEELIKNPVTDGRHRLTWLVLAPYLVNVKKLEDEEAVEVIRSFVSRTGETKAMNRFIQYNVKRARRTGLMPPTIGKLQSDHSDLYALLPKTITEKPSRTAKPAS
jgi:non-catalytic primase subunit PriX-like protein